MKRTVFTLIMVFLTALISTSAFGASGNGTLKVVFKGADGQVIAKSDVKSFHYRDMTDEPLISHIKVEEGLVTVQLPDRPVQFSAFIKVPKFGQVVVYADNNGKGYSSSGEIDFAKEAATTRLLRVRSALAKAKVEGVDVPGDFLKRLETAGKAPAWESLASGLTLGEEITMLRAKARIEKQKNPREGFLFGCNVFGRATRGPVYQQRFRELFNFGTTNLYLTGLAPNESTRNWQRTDDEVNWLLEMGKTVKICPPFYINDGVTPQWLKEKKPEEVIKLGHDIVYDEVKRYSGKTPFCEVANEAHDKSNACNLSQEDLVRMVKACSDGAREADPKVKRIINSCQLWGEYGARADKNGKQSRSPYRFLQDCIKGGVEFEIVGLQMYYPRYDLLETDRMLDKFATLGKPIHITEMGCSSADGLDPNAQYKRASPGWHGPWTEEMQADWVESVYTLFYSKPYVQAVAWWDLADAVSWWPYGGLLRGDCSPKPSYQRLQRLFTKWGYK